MKSRICFYKDGCKSKFIYFSLSLGYIASDQPEKAIKIFKDIKHPNDIIYTLLYSACAKLGTKEALNTIKQTVKNISKSFYSNPLLLTKLFEAFMKCDDFTSVRSLFESVARNIPGTPDL